MDRFLKWIQHPLVRICATGLCIWLLLRSIDTAKVFDSLLAADLSWIVAAVVLTGVVVACQVALWGLFLRCNNHIVPWRKLSSLLLQGLFWSHVLPAGVAGDAIRTVRIAKRVGEGNAIASLAASRLCEAFGVGLLAAAAMILLPQWFALWGYALLVAVLLAAVFVWMLLSRMHQVARLIDAEGSPLRRRVATFIGHIGEAAAGYYARPGYLSGALLLGVFAWVVNLAALLCFSKALGLALGWPIFALLVPASAFAALTPFAINGLGVREGIIVSLLAHVGVASTSAFAVAILMDLQLVPFVLIGGCCYLFERKR